MKGAIAERIAAVKSLSPDGLKLRTHGDYHLGQVLVRDAGFTIVDFEGDAALSIADRRQRRSPLDSARLHDLPALGAVQAGDRDVRRGLHGAAHGREGELRPRRVLGIALGDHPSGRRAGRERAGPP